MSLQPAVFPVIPENTVQVAHAAFPEGVIRLFCSVTNWVPYSTMPTSPASTPAKASPPSPAWRLALVTVMQFREDLSDRQATGAVRARIDWKYRSFQDWAA